MHYFNIDKTQQMKSNAIKNHFSCVFFVSKKISCVLFPIYNRTMLVYIYLIEISMLNI